jgi:hypothetical protein
LCRQVEPEELHVGGCGSPKRPISGIAQGLNRGEAGAYWGETPRGVAIVHALSAPHRSQLVDTS